MLGLAGQLSICGKKFNFAIFLDTINIINDKLCMMVVLIELYPLIPLSVTLIVYQGHRRITVLTENSKFLSD